MAVASSHPARQSHQWKQQDYTIRFRIGDIFLFGVRRQAMVRQTHFIGSGATAAELQLPAPAFHDGVELYYLPSVPTGARFPNVSRSGNVLRYCLRRYQRHYIHLNGSFADYLAKFRSKPRRMLRKKAELWAEQMGEARVYTHPGEMEEYARHCRQVSALTFQELVSGDGFPRHPSYVSELEEQAVAGLVRGYVLFAGTKPAAYAHCFSSTAAPEVLLYDTVGYDPEDRDWSPGTVLLYRILEDVHAGSRYRVFDFGIGDHAYKRFFATGSTEVVDVLCLADGWRNRLLVGSHYALRQVSAAGRWVADRLGVLEDVKRWARG